MANSATDSNSNQGAAAAHRAQEDPLLRRRVRLHREARIQQRHQAREVCLRRVPVRARRQVRGVGVPQGITELYNICTNDQDHHL